MCLISAPEFLASLSDPSGTHHETEIQSFWNSSADTSLLLITKSDLVSPTQLEEGLKSLSKDILVCPISIPTLSGCQNMIELLKSLLKTKYVYLSYHIIWS